MFLQFKVNNGNYAIDAKKVKELIKFRDIKIVETPKSANDVLGIVSYRNEMIHVLDFQMMMKVGKTNLKKDNFILLVLQNNTAIVIDNEVEIFSELKKSENTNIKIEACTDIGFNNKGDIVCNLNLKKLFNIS